MTICQVILKVSSSMQSLSLRCSAWENISSCNHVEKNNLKQQVKDSAILRHGCHMDVFRLFRLGYMTSWQITVIAEQETSFAQMI